MPYKPGDIAILSIHAMLVFEVVEVVDTTDPHYPKYRILDLFADYGDKTVTDPNKIGSCSASNLSPTFYHYFDRKVQTFYPDTIYEFCKSNNFAQACAKYPQLCQPNPIKLLSFSELSVDNQQLIIFQGTGNPYYGRATSDFYWYMPSLKVRSMDDEVRKITGVGTGFSATTFKTIEEAIANFRVWINKHKMNEKYLFYDIATNINKTLSFVPYSDGRFSVTRTHNSGEIVYVFIDNEADFKAQKASKMLTGTFVVRRLQNGVGVQIVAVQHRIPPNEVVNDSVGMSGSGQNLMNRANDYLEFPDQDFNKIAYEIVQKIYSMFDGLGGFDNDNDDDDDIPDTPYDPAGTPSGKVLQYASKQNWWTKLAYKHLKKYAAELNTQDLHNVLARAIQYECGGQWEASKPESWTENLERITGDKRLGEDVGYSTSFWVTCKQGDGILNQKWGVSVNFTVTSGTSHTTFESATGSWDLTIAISLQSAFPASWTPQHPYALMNKQVAGADNLKTIQEAALFVKNGIINSQRNDDDDDEDDGDDSPFDPTSPSSTYIESPVGSPVLASQLKWKYKYAGLLEDIDSAFDSKMWNWDKRTRFTQQYGWSVPTKEAIIKIKEFVGNDRVLEVGAGKGVWAKLMQESGIQITPPICM